MFHRMRLPMPQSFRFPVVVALFALSFLGRIDTAQAQEDSLTVSQSLLNFNSPVGGPTQSSNIQVGSTAASLNYSVTFSSSPSWLSVSTSQNVTPGTITVTASPFNLAVGTYTGTVT